MESSSESSISDNSDLVGHHETWDDVVGSLTQKVHKLEEEVKQLQWKKDHLEWHCVVYQHTLGKLGGMVEHEKSVDEFRNREEPVCIHCKMEQLLKRIQVLEEKAKHE